MYKRRAARAGSWYLEDGDELKAQLDGWLQEVKCTVDGTIHGVISPHAGFRYSGSTAAHSFRHLDPSKIKRIFVLGPSHRVYTRRCELSAASVCQTPCGDLTVDQDVIEELYKTGKFGKMTQKMDEDEHSIEMQLPYLAHVIKDHACTIVPIMVGATSNAAEAEYGRLLAPYLEDPTSFFVISSDFCHWGTNFDFQPYNTKNGEIWQSIEAMDREGIEAIESMDPDAFYKYLSRTNNTICGRHPIGVFLQAIKASKLAPEAKIQFVAYRQSSKCRVSSDSSVSYASGICHTDLSRDPSN